MFHFLIKPLPYASELLKPKNFLFRIGNDNVFIKIIEDSFYFTSNANRKRWSYRTRALDKEGV